MNYKTTINKVQAKYRRLYANNRNFVLGFYTGVLVATLVALVL